MAAFALLGRCGAGRGARRMGLRVCPAQPYGERNSAACRVPLGSGTGNAAAPTFLRGGELAERPVGVGRRLDQGIVWVERFGRQGALRRLQGVFLLGQSPGRHPKQGAAIRRSTQKRCDRACEGARVHVGRCVLASRTGHARACMPLAERRPVQKQGAAGRPPHNAQQAQQAQRAQQAQQAQQAPAPARTARLSDPATLTCTARTECAPPRAAAPRNVLASCRPVPAEHGHACPRGLVDLRAVQRASGLRTPQGHGSPRHLDDAWCANYDRRLMRGDITLQRISATRQNLWCRCGVA